MPEDKTLQDYINRKMLDNMQPSPSKSYKPTHGGYPGTSADDFKPARDLPGGSTPV